MDMKTATVPSFLVDAEFCRELESAMVSDETVAEFVEAAVRSEVQRRGNRSEFHLRGLLSLEDARQTGSYVEDVQVLQKLQRKLDAARSRLSSRS
jgi:hypothetical protein